MIYIKHKDVFTLSKEKEIVAIDRKKK